MSLEFDRITGALFEEDAGQLLRALLLRGCDPNVRGPGDFTPLHRVAMLSGGDFGQGEKITLLIEFGAEPDARVSTMFGNGWTPLHLAVYEGVPKAVSALLRGGADPNSITDSGLTPLSLAVEDPVNGQPNICTLVKHGADLRVLYGEGLHLVDRAKKKLARMEAARRVQDEPTWRRHIVSMREIVELLEELG